MGLEELNGYLKIILEDKKVLEFKVAKKYYMDSCESSKEVIKQINLWIESKSMICFEKIKKEDTFNKSGHIETKVVVTKEEIQFDEIGKRCEDVLHLLDKAYEVNGRMIFNIPIQIDNKLISFDLVSKDCLTTYKIYEIVM